LLGARASPRPSSGRRSRRSSTTTWGRSPSSSPSRCGRSWTRSPGRRPCTRTTSSSPGCRWWWPAGLASRPG